MDYTVVHSGRRTIAIQIQRDGRVVVRAPYAATAEDIRRVVDSHRDWVEKTVRRQQEQLAASPPEPTAREMEELARQGREYLYRLVETTLPDYRQRIALLKQPPAIKVPEPK